MNFVPDFGDPEECQWCGDEARGRTQRDDGYWAPTCHRDGCDDDGPYRGAA